ncbi:UDP-N-acetylglucosamine transferase subunit [Lambiella insularis]|nr:UDP-N-acetylglucosamine transferase subunit [Lambiella insularis]
MFSIYLITTAILATLILLTIWVILTLPALYTKSPMPRRRGTPTHLLIVLGSGGHTAEMLSLLRDLDPLSYTHRSYVVSSGDDFSASKAVEFEQGLHKKFQSHMVHSNRDQSGGPDQIGEKDSYGIAFVPRARQIHQSLLTTPISALRCLVACLSVLCSPPISSSSISSSSRTRSYPPSFPPVPPSVPLVYPHLILTNGPATATILILASRLLRLLPAFLLAALGLPQTAGMMRCIYIESWARVRRMSLSGKILVAGGLCERVIVQWERLAREGWGWRDWGRREFRGVLVR